MFTLSEAEDHVLLELLQKQETIGGAAFEELYNRYWHKMLAVAAHRMGSTEEGQEIVQDVFCKLWQRRFAIQLTAPLPVYLAAAVKYEVLNRLAKNQRSVAYKAHASSLHAVAANSTEQYMRFEELKAQLEQTVRALPEKCRLVYRLSREQGFSEKEIAQELHISTKTVEAHLTKALKLIRLKLRHMHLFFSHLL